MITDMMLEDAFAYLKDLDEEQISILKNALIEQIPDNTLQQKLGVDDQTFKTISQILSEIKEKAVFAQVLSEDEMETVAGGIPKKKSYGYPCQATAATYCPDVHREDPADNCSYVHYRQAYGGNGFPNCAATFEDNSICGNNDACFSYAINYRGMNSCYKAWK